MSNLNDCMFISRFLFGFFVQYWFSAFTDLGRCVLPSVPRPKSGQSVYDLDLSYIKEPKELCKILQHH